METGKVSLVLLLLSWVSGDVGKLFCFGLLCFGVFFFFLFCMLSMCLSTAFESRVCLNTVKINANIHVTFFWALSLSFFSIK